MIRLAGILILLTALGGDVLASLDAAKAEPRLEKRSELAMDNAEVALAAARTAWKEGRSQEFEAKLNEVRESVDLCLAALHETGKSPNKLLKYYKRGELKTRELTRRLESFLQEASFDERPVIEKVTDRVKIVHEELLLGVMSRKK